MFEETSRAHERLAREPIAWLTTVASNGQPQTSPVWFLVEGEELLIYSKPTTSKVDNVRANPRVSLHLDGDGQGGDIVTIEGTARVVEDHPAADAVPAYVEKYAPLIAGNGWTPASFAADYSLPVRVRFDRGRAW